MEPVNIFLDSNVLFSLCWSEPERTILGELLKLRERGDIRLFVSSLVIQEAKDNLQTKRPESLPRLNEVLALCIILHGSLSNLILPLPEQDRLILSTAVANGVDFFLTGNTSDFGALLRRKVNRTKILTPRMFLEGE